MGPKVVPNIVHENDENDATKKPILKALIDGKIALYCEPIKRLWMVKKGAIVKR